MSGGTMKVAASILAGLGMLAWAAAGANAAAAAAGDKWVVDAAPDKCTLTRRFDTAPAAVTLSWWRVPTRRNSTLWVTEQGRPTEEPGSVRVTFGDRTATVDARVARQSAAGQRRWSVVLPDVLLADAKGSESLTLTPARGAPIAIALPTFAGAWRALDACVAKVATFWGLDPAEDALIATPPSLIGSIADYYNPQDYPRAALLAGAGGSTGILVAIDAAGVATGCRAILSSGRSDLDRASCRPARPLRFTPAVGRDGAPVAGHALMTVMWYTS
ncbi:energy transducer TonB [uncultured Sphingomonas sp.]|uniref:energy transducer TonB n=1 Tax=uncultured Sphingomonas sp. TaxID=158754 RepID=UPI00258E492F|nr:energy transducer TonB [uncultured Sphingomonas sp.]